MSDLLKITEQLELGAQRSLIFPYGECVYSTIEAKPISRKSADVIEAKNSVTKGFLGLIHYS